MLSTIASLIAIAYLPGAIVFRLPVADRAKRASLPAEERLFWAVIISILITTTLAFVLAAMGAYSLRALLWCDVLIAAGLALATLGNLRLSGGAGLAPRNAPYVPRPSWTAAIPVVLIAAGVWMYFAVPAAEYVLGGRDPGVYVSEGIQIAQRQSLATTDRVAAEIPASTRDLFFPSYLDPNYYSVRFMGFHLRDPDSGTVTGQFPQGYPIWIAIAYGLDGVTGTRRVIAWWAILGVLAVYFAAQRLIGPLPAAAAAGLVCVHIIQTWYARYPNSEIVTQVLLLAALLAHAYAHEDDDRFFGPVAASALGLALFARFPEVLAVGAAVAASLLAHVSGHRARAGFLVTMAAWTAAAGAYYLTQLRPYFSRPITYVQSLEPIHLAPLAAGAAATCVLMWASRRPRVAAASRTFLPLALIAVVTLGGIYALYFREPGGRLAPHDAHAVRIFAHLYFTPIAFLLALVGYALVVWRSFWRAPALILAITLLSVFFFYKMRIWPEHFWLARRFIPTILPAAAIFAAAALFGPLWLLPRERLWPGRRTVGSASAAVGLIGTIILGQHYLSASQPIRTHVEYANAIPQLESLAQRFGDDDLVIVEARESSELHTLALPLSYIWARNVLVLYRARPDKAMFAEFVSWARTKYDNVYFLGGGGPDGTDLVTTGIRMEQVKADKFQTPVFEATSYETLPARLRTLVFDHTIYRILDNANEDAAYRVDVGGFDEFQVFRFHAKERLGRGGTTFRWTRDRSSFSVPRITPDNRELVLRMSNGRPRTAPPARVTVFLADQAIGAADPVGEFRDYLFAIPAELAARLAAQPTGAEIRLESTTWTPRDVAGGGDDRVLGVMIDRAEIR
jgi:hypothetical protein